MIEDRFHLGSDTKAFTSLLAGQFVEAAKLRWDSTLAEIFPELEDKMDAEFAKIALEQLLSTWWMANRKRCWPVETETIPSFLGPPARYTCQSWILKNGSPGMGRGQASPRSGFDRNREEAPYYGDRYRPARARPARHAED